MRSLLAVALLIAGSMTPISGLAAIKTFQSGTATSQELCVKGHKANLRPIDCGQSGDSDTLSGSGFWSGQTQWSGSWQDSGSTDAVVPLPASLPLLAVALGAFGVAAWRRKRAKS